MAQIKQDLSLAQLMSEWIDKPVKQCYICLLYSYSFSLAGKLGTAVLSGPRERTLRSVKEMISEKIKYEHQQLSLRGWLVVVGLVVLIILALVQFFGSRAGVIGAINVTGNSCQDVAPEGSMAITWPSRPREDDLVIAWTDGQADGDKPNSDKPGRIIKQLKGEKICSTANGVKYSKPHYRITGKVLFILHIEKVLWWRNTGAQNPAPNMPKLTEERKTLGGISTRLEKDRIKVFVDSGSPAWRKFDGLKIGDGSKPIVIILPERCKTAGVIYGSSASAVLVFYSGTGREIARLRGVMPEVQRISAPKGELISKAKLCIEEGAPSAQMGKLTAIRKIE